MENKIKIPKEVVEKIINYLQDNRIDKDERFILLKKCYAAIDEKITKFEMIQACNEVQRLSGIGESRPNINHYIESL